MRLLILRPLQLDSLFPITCPHMRMLIFHFSLFTRCFEMAASMLLSLVNTSVVSATNKTILCWSILEVPEEVQTIEQFFRRGVLARIAEEDSRRCDLLSAYIGRDREMLDHVDLNLPIVLVVVSFGPFLKFVVRGINFSRFGHYRTCRPITKYSCPFHSFCEGN